MAAFTKAVQFAFLAYTLTITGVSAQNKSWEKVSIATEGAYAPWNMTAAGGTLEGFEID